jgi:predicted esterase
MNNKYILASLFLFTYASFLSQSQPSQPSNGPGGLLYTHSSVNKYDFNPSFTSDGYWMYEPTNPKPDSANVIVFNHGYGVYNPGPYGSWIEHLVRKGNIVIFPRYQYNITIPLPSAFTNNTAKAIRDALTELTSNLNYVQPKYNNFVIIGHSYGGVITSNLAIQHSSYGIPKPKAIMLCMPGTSIYTLGRINSYSAMDSSINVLSIIGENDIVVGDTFGLEIFNTTTNIPTSHKNLVELKKDNYGSPNMAAGHNVCLASNISYDGGTIGSVITGAYVEARTNAVDFYCFWKLADALIDCSINGTNCDYAFGDTPNQKSMGSWSDGSPVIPLNILPKSVVSINEESPLSSIKVFPNPTQNYLTIKADLDIEKVIIRNILGETIKNVTLNTNTIDISDLKKGQYFILIETKKGVTTLKFLKL